MRRLASTTTLLSLLIAANIARAENWTQLDGAAYSISNDADWVVGTTWNGGGLRAYQRSGTGFIDRGGSFYNIATGRSGSSTMVMGITASGTLHRWQVDRWVAEPVYRTCDTLVPFYVRSTPGTSTLAFIWGYWWAIGTKATADGRGYELRRQIWRGNSMCWELWGQVGYVEVAPYRRYFGPTTQIWLRDAQGRVFDMPDLSGTLLSFTGATIWKIGEGDRAIRMVVAPTGDHWDYPLTYYGWELSWQPLDAPAGVTPDDTFQVNGRALLLRDGRIFLGDGQEMIPPW